MTPQAVVTAMSLLRGLAPLLLDEAEASSGRAAGARCEAARPARATRGCWAGRDGTVEVLPALPIADGLEDRAIVVGLGWWWDQGCRTPRRREEAWAGPCARWVRRRQRRCCNQLHASRSRSRALAKLACTVSRLACVCVWNSDFVALACVGCDEDGRDGPAGAEAGASRSLPCGA